MNSIFFDNSKSFLISTNLKGFSIYNLNNFNKIYENENISYSIKICKIFYLSNIILFVPLNKENELIIYDDKIKKEIGNIIFKEEILINNFDIIKNFIFIQLNNSIKIFDIINLNIINEINDVDNKISFILYENNNKIFCLNILSSNKNIFKISNFNIENNNNNNKNFVTEIVKTNLNNEIKNFAIDNKNFEYLICIDNNLNINLFKIENFDLIIEMKIKSIFNIIDVHLFKNEFLLVFFSNNYIKIYNLNNNNNNFNNNENDNKNFLNVFCEYKLEKNYLDVSDIKNKILINYYKKSEFLIINSLNNIYKKIKFNTKEKNQIWEISKINFV